MKKNLIRLIALLLLSILPFASFVFYTESLPNQYANTYLAEWEHKYERLYSTEGKKIILIGVNFDNAAGQIDRWVFEQV